MFKAGEGVIFLVKIVGLMYTVAFLISVGISLGGIFLNLQAVSSQANIIGVEVSKYNFLPEDIATAYFGNANGVLSATDTEAIFSKMKVSSFGFIEDVSLSDNTGTVDPAKIVTRMTRDRGDTVRVVIKFRAKMFFLLPTGRVDAPIWITAYDRVLPCRRDYKD